MNFDGYPLPLHTLKVVHTEKHHLDSVFPESVQVLKYEKFWHRNIHEETKLKLELKVTFSTTVTAFYNYNMFIFC